jgi:hypothetical protein
MKKFVLSTLAAASIMLAVPEFASATPLAAGGELAAAASELGGVEQARYYRRYRLIRFYRVHRWHRRCWHRRHWSGRRCW